MVQTVDGEQSVMNLKVHSSSLKTNSIQEIPEFFKISVFPFLYPNKKEQCE
jgi:hypothetical protein